MLFFFVTNLELESYADGDNTVVGFNALAFGACKAIHFDFVESVGEVVGVASAEEQAHGHVVANSDSTADVQTVVEFIVGVDFLKIIFDFAEISGVFIGFAINFAFVFVVTAEASTQLRTAFNCQTADIVAEHNGKVDVVGGHSCFCGPFYTKVFTFVFVLATLLSEQKFSSNAHVFVKEEFAHNTNIESGFHTCCCGILAVDVVEGTAGFNAKFELSHQA